MSNQLRLLPTDASPRPETPRPRRRRQQGPSAPIGRISTRTRRAGRQGVAAAREALQAATTRPDADSEPAGSELRRAG